jgi:Uma2 family endonuclease
MTADEYLALPDDGYKYELINGVVLMSPGPSFEHQDLGGQVYLRMGAYVVANRLGKVLYETDVRFGPDLVYRPDIVFYSTERAAGIRRTPTIAPDLVVEFLSPRTRVLDLRTKRGDYERHGVCESWVIGAEAAWRFVLRNGAYVEEEIKGDRIVSEVIAGFVLDLRAARGAAAGGGASGEPE